MLILITRRLYRLLLAVIISLLTIPLLHFYVIRAVNPAMVSFHKPHSEDITVLAQYGEIDRDMLVLTKFQRFLHEFYQNGI